MKILFVSCLAAPFWLILGVVAFAACGWLWACFGCGFGVVACMLGASRLWDMIKVDREWSEATKWETKF